MRVAAVVVGTDTEHFHQVNANGERLQLAERIAAFTKDAADIVLLPAGFLAVKAEREVKRRAESLAAIFGRQALLAGVDELDGARSGAKNWASAKSGDTTYSREGYPFWVFASRAGKVTAGPWRQRSRRSSEPVTDPAARCVSIGNTRIGVLICGELYNRELADHLAQARPDIVVDLAHLSMTRFTRSLHRVAQTTGRPVFHVQHVAGSSRKARKWRATRRGARGDHAADWASYNEPRSSDSALWAEVKIWDD